MSRAIDEPRGQRARNLLRFPISDEEIHYASERSQDDTCDVELIVRTYPGVDDTVARNIAMLAYAYGQKVMAERWETSEWALDQAFTEGGEEEPDVTVVDEKEDTE
jgi:hypothetical protein